MENVKGSVFLKLLCYKGTAFKLERDFSGKVFLVYKTELTPFRRLKRKHSWNEVEYAMACARQKVSYFYFLISAWHRKDTTPFPQLP